MDLRLFAAGAMPGLQRLSLCTDSSGSEAVGPMAVTSLGISDPAVPGAPCDRADHRWGLDG